jgi:hypothetical protein
MAPEPIATGIHASGLLQAGLWVCLRLQTEGSSAGHYRRMGSLGGREKSWDCAERTGRAEAGEGGKTMEWAEMTEPGFKGWVSVSIT